jgi:4-hydroxybenzoate polyprenyltransferase
MMRRLLPYAQLVRLPNAFTAMADIALAAWASGALAGRWGVFACLLATSTLLYWSGMVWNDYFDLAQDRKERPKRPLPSGRISTRTAARLGIGLMLAGLACAALADGLAHGERRLALPLAAALVVAIFAYDGWLKRTWAGPIAMGTCRSLNVLLGLSILGRWPPGWGFLLALVVGVYIAGVTWFARTEARLSSRQALASAAAVILASLFLALGVPALAQVNAPAHQPSLLFPYLLAAFALYLALALVPALQEPLPRHVQPAIKRAVLGLVLFDALLASALVGTPGLLLSLLLLPGLYLGRWVYST